MIYRHTFRIGEKLRDNITTEASDKQEAIELFEQDFPTALRIKTEEINT